MKLSQIIFSEIRFRSRNALVSVLAVVIGAACVVVTLSKMHGHEVETAQLLDEREAELTRLTEELNDEMRKITKRLGFNVRILPREQNLGEFYAEDFAAKTMPESYATVLSESSLITVQHLLPILLQRATWPEQKDRSIMVIGIRSEQGSTKIESAVIEGDKTSSFLAAGTQGKKQDGDEAKAIPAIAQKKKKPKTPIIQPVPMGKVVLGYELHTKQGWEVGDKITILGREFEIHEMKNQRGTKDDITMWIPLKTAQEIFSLEGRINEIQALQCKCAWADIAKIRGEIEKVLPQTQVIEIHGKALARAEARTQTHEATVQLHEDWKRSRAAIQAQWEKTASIVIPLVLVASVALVGTLMYFNVRDRQSEIGILGALGLSSVKVSQVFLGKALILGVVGGGLGVLCGVALAAGLHPQDSVIQWTQSIHVGALFATFFLTPVWMLLAAWLPATWAAQQDPADILHED